MLLVNVRWNYVFEKHRLLSVNVLQGTLEENKRWFETICDWLDVSEDQVLELYNTNVNEQ